MFWRWALTKPVHLMIILIFCLGGHWLVLASLRHGASWRYTSSYSDKVVRRVSHRFHIHQRDVDFPVSPKHNLSIYLMAVKRWLCSVVWIICHHILLSINGRCLWPDATWYQHNCKHHDGAAVRSGLPLCSVFAIQFVHPFCQVFVP